MKNSIVSNCTNCHKEDSINTLNGLCPACTDHIKWNVKKDREQELRDDEEKYNNETRI